MDCLGVFGICCGIFVLYEKEEEKPAGIGGDSLPQCWERHSGEGESVGKYLNANW